MFNWYEIEEMARTRHAEISRCLTTSEHARLRLLQEMEAARKPLKSRLASALVRIGARIDPKTVVVHDAGDALTEGRLAAYLR